MQIHIFVCSERHGDDILVKIGIEIACGPNLDLDPVVGDKDRFGSDKNPVTQAPQTKSINGAAGLVAFGIQGMVDHRGNVELFVHCKMQAHEPLPVDLQGNFKCEGLPLPGHLKRFSDDLFLGEVDPAFRWIADRLLVDIGCGVRAPLLCVAGRRQRP